MQLGICVIRCPFGFGDYQTTVDSIKNLPVNYCIYDIKSYIEVQQHLATTHDDWTLILRDREALDYRFNEAIGVMLTEETVQAYKFYCTIKTVDAPTVIEQFRLFRHGVHLRDQAFRPVDLNSHTVKILDGWIYEHGTEHDICENSWDQTVSQHS